MIVKGDTTNLNAVGYEPFTRDNSPLLSVTKTDILFNGLRAQHTGTITVELRYNDNGSLYDKDTMMRFVDLDTASEEVKMDNSFDGKHYVPGISPMLLMLVVIDHLRLTVPTHQNCLQSLHSCYRLGNHP